MTLFTPASAYDRDRDIDSTYAYSPHSNSWIPTDFDCISLSTDEEGFPILHGDMGVHRIGGTLHTFHEDDTVTEAPIPLEPWDFLPSMYLAYPEVHKEGFTYIWGSRDQLTADRIQRLASWHGLRLAHVGATVDDLKDQLEECFVQDEES